MVGLHTDVCRVNLILVHTDWLQNGLAGKVAAQQTIVPPTLPHLDCPMPVTVQIESVSLLLGVKQLEREADHLTVCHTM
jgi:hypothetical protein